MESQNLLKKVFKIILFIFVIGISHFIIVQINNSTKVFNKNEALILNLVSKNDSILDLNIYANGYYHILETRQIKTFNNNFVDTLVFSSPEDVYAIDLISDDSNSVNTIKADLKLIKKNNEVLNIESTIVENSIKFKPLVLYQYNEIYVWVLAIIVFLIFIIAFIPISFKLSYLSSAIIILFALSYFNVKTSQLGLVILIIVLIINNINHFQKKISSKILIPIILLFVIRLIGHFWAIEAKTSIRLIETSVSLLIIPILLINVDEINKFEFKEIPFKILIVSIFFSFLIIIFTFFKVDLHSIDFMSFLEHRKYWHDGFALAWSDKNHPTFISFNLIVSYLFGHKYLKNTSQKVLIYLIFLFSIYLMGSRFGFLMFILIPGIFLIEKINLRKIALPITILFTLFQALSLLILINFNLDDERSKLYRIALENLKGHWLNGFGNGGMTYFLKSKESIELLNKNLNHFHNQYIDYLFQFGIFGLLFVIFFFSFYVFYASRKNSSITLMFIFLLSIFSLIESPLNTLNGVIFFSIYLTFNLFYLSKISDNITFN